MSSQIMPLPCENHAHCAVHGHHSTTISSTTPTLYVDEEDNALELEQSNNPDLAETTDPSPIQRLPVEVLLHAVDNLSAYNKLSLALTCRSLFRILERDVCLAKEDMSLSRLIVSEMGAARHEQGRSTAGTNDANEFLRSLVRDLSDRYWHCEECVALHLRALESPGPTGMIARLPSMRSLLGLQQPSAEDPSFRLRIGEQPFYEIPFSTARAVMDRHFQKGKGVCINALRCSGAHKFPCTVVGEKDDMELRYRFELKIVLDRLLLKATYTWEEDDYEDKSKRHIFPQRLRDLRLRTAWLIKGSRPWLCEHLDIIAALAAAARHLGREEQLRCQYCPTQYSVTQHLLGLKGHQTEIQVWQNLGSCRSLKEDRWKHLVSRWDTKSEYRWRKWSQRTWTGQLKGDSADENIRVAFERVGFTTRKGFEEAEGKLGFATWDGTFQPDPFLDARLYNHERLPRHVAETI